MIYYCNKKVHVSWCEFMTDMDSVWVLPKIFFKIPLNGTRKRPSSWDRLRKNIFGILPKESLSACTLSEHLAVSFLSDMGFFAFLMRLFADPVG